MCIIYLRISISWSSSQVFRTEPVPLRSEYKSINPCCGCGNTASDAVVCECFGVTLPNPNGCKRLGSAFTPQRICSINLPTTRSATRCLTRSLPMGQCPSSSSPPPSNLPYSDLYHVLCALAAWCYDSVHLFPAGWSFTHPCHSTTKIVATS